MSSALHLYAWTWRAFGLEPFTAARFRIAVPTPSPAKVLHDMVQRGFLDRIRRGLYRVVPPEGLIDRILADTTRQLDLPAEAGLPYAYSRDTAAIIWSDGLYFAGFTRAYVPQHLKVRAEDLDLWRTFFREHGAMSTVEGERRTRYGIVFVLHPEESVVAVTKDGIQVEPLEDTLAYMEENMPSYAPAVDYLRGERSFPSSGE